MKAAIAVEQLVKSYGPLRAVDGVSFEVAPGELFALLGPNGAGKTTTVEILEGYRAADEGAVRVLGLDPRDDGARLRPRIGVMLQQGGIYPAVSSREVLHLFASYFADPLDPDELLRRVGLERVGQTRYRRLSGGQKQRLSLALALIGQPEVLFLDEPTAAMDPQARQATWELIREFKQQGATILLTTHFMDEAERLADRVAIIDHGRLVALDRPRALIERGGSSDSASLLSFSTQPGLDTSVLSAILGGGQVREAEPGRYEAAVELNAALLAELTRWLRDEGALLTELRVGHRSLEDVFLNLTGHHLRD